MRSWTVTTTAARQAGGAAKLVAWNTSTAPASHSTGGNGSLAQAACSSRAGTRRRPWRTRWPAGATLGRSAVPRQVNGTSATSRGSGPGSAARASTSPAT